MAAQKKKDRKFPQAEFDMPLADAIAELISPSEIDEGDQWHFHVEGETLLITRIRAPEDVPGNGPSAQSNSKARR